VPKTYYSCPTLAPVEGAYSHIESVKTQRGKGNTAVLEAHMTWKTNSPSEGTTMTFFKFANKFNQDEDGAVTVDWVVLTAAIVGLGVAVLSTVSNGTNALGDKISTELAGRDLGETVETTE
jgi:Flp pilus assembly pilin Flp